MTDRTALFHQHRPRLYGIAYRMLGTKADAEDMLQEAWMRWHDADVERIQTPQAWLVTVLTRLCIDRLRALRREREEYVGPWLPEPLQTASSPAAEQQAELASDLSVAFLVMLERLTPEERAGFLLHEVFECDYGEIAGILGKNAAACRQLVHRAREHVRRDRPRFQVSEAARGRLIEKFLAAMRAHDKAALLALLAEDATWTTDGGGKTKAARKVISGSERVSRFALGVWRQYLSKTVPHPTTINGESGLVMTYHGQPVSVLSIETDGLRILGIYIVINPDKLTGIDTPENLPD